MKAKENNGKSQEDIAIRNIYFCAYLISKGVHLKKSDIQQDHTTWYFDYDERIFTLQKEYYTDIWLQQFIGALKDIKKQIIDNRRNNNGKKNK